MNLSYLRLSAENMRPGAIAYMHGRSTSRGCAFSLGERIRIKITLPRALGTTSLTVILYSECGGEISRHCGEWCSSQSENDYYLITLPKSIDVGLYFYTVELFSACGTLYAYPHNDGVLFTENAPHRRFQLSISDFKYNKPDGVYGGIIYHIFVDRFAIGGRTRAKKGSVRVKDWSMGVPEYPEYPGAPLKNNTFYGGTLWGIIEKLPYIASLGANLIYLSPIFEAASNHKYDTANYMKVDSMFGGEKALRALVNEAEKFGIAIILDGVFNHTGSDSIYFNRYASYNSTGAYQSKESPYYSWYDFEAYPDKYTSWWGIEILPRINPDNPDCREYFTGRRGVISKYAKMGIAGFRLDVVDELSDDFVKDIKSTLNEYNPSSLLFGEVWEDASNKIAYSTRKSYYLGEELDGVMNYPLRKGLISYILNNDVEPLRYALTDIIDNAPPRIANMQMNLLGTHDTERILTVLGGESSLGKTNDYLATKRMTADERKVAILRLKMAYTVISALPGLPMIFYGDEAGLEGYSDPFNRMPYPWGEENNDLLCHYQRIGKIRRDNKIYRSGDFELLHLDRDLLVFKRSINSTAHIIIANNGNRPISVNATYGSLDTIIGDPDKIPQYGVAIIKATKHDIIYIKQL